jgi:hypothetical protein
MIDVKKLAESKMGAAGILQRRGQSAAQRLARQQQQVSPSKTLPPSTNLSKLFGINVVGQPTTPKLPPGGVKSLVKQAKRPGGLQSLQQQAKHKGQTPSNKPSWHIAKSIGKKALSYHSPIGLGLTAGLDAVVPGLGFVARAVQQTFGDNVEKSHVLSTLAVLTDARYPHRIPKVAKDPTDTNLDFTYGPDGMKKRRKKPMDRLINPNGQYLR